MSKRIKTQIAAAVVLTISFALPAQAQDAKTRDEAPPAVETRTYDISEFLQTIPDYPLPPEQTRDNTAPPLFNPGRASAAPATVPAAGASPVQDKLDTLERLIMDTVDPDSWKDNGGRVGALRILGTLMVISQTPADQKAVQTLLDGLLSSVSSSVLVEVDARWALLTPEQLADWRHVTPVKAEALLGDLAKDHDAFYCQGRVLGFNGQTVSLTSGQTSSIVTGVTPVVGTGVAAYDVTTARERSGVSLQVTPRLAPHQNGIVVDVHSKVSEDVAPTAHTLGGLIPLPTTQPAEANGPGRIAVPPGPVGQPDRLETAFDTTVRLTPGVPLVVGGMTREPGKQGSRQLCLILTARTIDPSTDKALPAK